MITIMVFSTHQLLYQLLIIHAHKTVTISDYYKIIHYGEVENSSMFKAGLAELLSLSVPE